MRKIEEAGRVGQIYWKKMGELWEIRHIQDQGVAVGQLKSLRTLDQLEELVRWDGQGRYRPLRSEENLVPGWHYQTNSAEGFREAIEVIYPGALGNWSAQQNGKLRVIDWKGAVKKQTESLQILIEGEKIAVEETKNVLCLARCSKTPLWAGESIFGKAGTAPFICVEPCPVFFENVKSLCKPKT